MGRFREKTNYIGMWFASTFCGMYAMCVSTLEAKEPSPHGGGVNWEIVSNPLWELETEIWKSRGALLSSLKGFKSRSEMYDP